MGAWFILFPLAVVLAGLGCGGAVVVVRLYLMGCIRL
jgi:hypothetical protein